MAEFCEKAVIPAHEYDRVVRVVCDGCGSEGDVCSLRGWMAPRGRCLSGGVVRVSAIRDHVDAHSNSEGIWYQICDECFQRIVVPALEAAGIEPAENGMLDTGGINVKRNHMHERKQEQKWGFRFEVPVKPG